MSKDECGQEMNEEGLKTLCRDWDWEKRELLRARIEYELMVTLKKGSVQYWLPNALKDCEEVDSSGFEDTKLMKLEGKFYWVDTCQGKYRICYEDHDPRAQGVFRERQYSLGGVYGAAYSPPGQKSIFSLVELFQVSRQKETEDEALLILRSLFQISDKKLLSAVSSSPWKFWSNAFDVSCLKNRHRALRFHFHDSENLFVGSVESYIKGNDIIYLPSVLIERSGALRFSPVPIIVNDNLPLYNLPQILKAEEAEIFLIDCLTTAHVRQADLDKIGDLSEVWTSWYCGPQKNLSVDLRSMKGRVVNYVIAGDVSRIQEKYSLAAAAYSKILKLSEVTLKFIDVTGGDPVQLSPEEFVEKARELDVDVNEGAIRKVFKEPLRVVPFKDMNTAEEVSYLLRPVIAEKSVTLLYAEPGVGKTWLAMSMAYATAFGMEFVPGRWEASSAKKVLYIDGEMGDESMARRNKKLSIAMLKGKVADKDFDSLQENLLFHCMNDDVLDLTKSEDQALVDNLIAHEKRETGAPVSLLVIDNLSTLTQFSDTGKSWNDLFSWLKKLKQRSISTLIVHHSNKKGVQRGSGIKTAVVDNVIRVEQHSSLNSAKISMRVVVEKGRELFGPATKPMTLELSPSSARPKWKVVPRFKNKKEKEELLIKLEEDESLSVEEKLAELEMKRSTYFKLRNDLIQQQRLVKAD